MRFSGCATCCARRSCRGRFAHNPLPGEDRLQSRYGVGRATIREALRILTEQGLIERVRGAGTFVVCPEVFRHRVVNSWDLVQNSEAGPNRVAFKLTHLELMPAPHHVAAKLEVDDGDDAIVFEQLSFLDGSLLSLRCGWWPADLLSAALTEGADLDRSPYEILEGMGRVLVGDTDLIVSASVADEHIAQLLGVAAGAALLDTERVIYNLDGRPAEFSMSHARGGSDHDGGPPCARCTSGEQLVGAQKTG